MEFVCEIQNVMFRSIVQFVFALMAILEMLNTAALKLDVDLIVSAHLQKLASTKNVLIHANTHNVDKMLCAKLITIIKLVVIATMATVEIL